MLEQQPLEAKTEAPERSASVENNGIGSMSLKDIQSLRPQPQEDLTFEALYQTNCPDGTVVFHPDKFGGSKACGQSS